MNLTTAQRDVVNRMVEKASARRLAGGGRADRREHSRIFHALLKQRADALGLVWPKDYPATGGWRGQGKKE